MKPTLEDRIEAIQMQVDPVDWAKWKAQHVTLYGHVPRTNTETREYCTHPMHGMASRDMAIGNIALRGEHVHPQMVKTQDDPEIDPAWADKAFDPVADTIKVFEDGE